MKWGQKLITWKYSYLLTSPEGKVELQQYIYTKSSKEY